MFKTYATAFEKRFVLNASLKSSWEMDYIIQKTSVNVLQYILKLISSDLINNILTTVNIPVFYSLQPSPNYCNFLVRSHSWDLQ